MRVQVYEFIVFCSQLPSSQPASPHDYGYVTISSIFVSVNKGAVLIEFMELWGEGRDEYIKDHWNFLDVLALVFCGAGFIVRMSHPDSLWGRALYGAGTPLLLCRVLFFVQFLPAQGPMIEVRNADRCLRFCL